MDRKTLFARRFSKWDPVQISCAAQTNNDTFNARTAKSIIAIIGLTVERTPTPISPISALKSAVLGREGGFSFADLQHPPTVNPLSLARCNQVSQYSQMLHKLVAIAAWSSLAFTGAIMRLPRKPRPQVSRSSAPIIFALLI
jgi:hypothetical protein